MKHIISGRLTALCIAAVISLPVVATAQTPPAAAERRDEAKDRLEQARERRDQARERREDAKERREDRREDAKDRREDAKERREDRREDAKEGRADRLERRRARIKELKERWGEVARKPSARAELKVHAHRMARLRRVREMAESKGKTDLVARIDKIIEREKARHQRVMDRIKEKGDGS